MPTYVQKVPMIGTNQAAIKPSATELSDWLSPSDSDESCDAISIAAVALTLFMFEKSHLSVAACNAQFASALLPPPWNHSCTGAIMSNANIMLLQAVLQF